MKCRFDSKWKISLAGLLGLATLAGAETQSPNIVMILADDLGSADLSCRGGEAETPNIDKLFFEGRSLERFYVQPQCTPTRAALMTGRYPARFGMHYGVVFPFSEWGLPLEERTLPEVLQEEGYTTAMVGKWHLGHANREMLPYNHGFDYFFGNYLGSLDYFAHTFPGNRGYDLHRNGKPVIEKGYITRVYGKEAAEIIRKHPTDIPLFLYLAFTAPHDPWQAPETTTKKYLDRGFNKDRSRYLAMVEEMDMAIGVMMSALKDAGMDESTLVFFSSDNGGPFDPQITDNGLLRGEKGMTYEGGIRVPAVARWKGQIPATSTSDGLFYIGDLFPTFIELAGGVPETIHRIDSFNILDSFVTGAPSPRKNVIQVTGPDWFWNGVITDRWKLTISVKNDRVEPRKREGEPPPNHELFDLSVDPFEETDVAHMYPEIYERLLKAWRGVYDQRVESQFSYDQTKGEAPEVWGEESF